MLDRENKVLEFDNTGICHFLWPSPLRHPDRLTQHESLLPALCGKIGNQKQTATYEVRSFLSLFFAGHVPRVRPLECYRFSVSGNRLG